MKRIKLKYGTARVSDNISAETIEALNKLTEVAYNHVPKEKNEAIDRQREIAENILKRIKKTPKL